MRLKRSFRFCSTFAEYDFVQMAWQYLQSHMERFSALSAALLRRHTALCIRARRFRQGVRLSLIVSTVGLSH